MAQVMCVCVCGGGGGLGGNAMEWHMKSKTLGNGTTKIDNIANMKLAFTLCRQVWMRGKGGKL